MSRFPAPMLNSLTKTFQGLRPEPSEGEWTIGQYDTTEAMIKRLRETPQSCVCRKSDQMLIALCGDADDRQSQVDADIMSASKELLNVVIRMRDRFQTVMPGDDALWRDVEYAIDKANGKYSPIEGIR